MATKTFLKEDVLIINGDFELLKKSLDENKVVLAAIEMGENISKSVEDNWSDFLQAHAQLKGPINHGVCFCNKPATHLVFFWK